MPAVALAALVGLACIVPLAPAQAPDRTVSFTTPAATAPAVGVGVGVGPFTMPSTQARPKLGVDENRITFRFNAADRRARRSAKQSEAMRARAEKAHGLASLATERIAAIELLLAEAQDDEERLRAAIAERAVAQYKSGDGGDLSFLLSSNGLRDMLERGNVLAERSERDTRLVEDYQLSIARLEELELVLAELRDTNSERAVLLDERADRLDDQLVSARVAHMEAPDPASADARRAADGTWYVMDGAFDVGLFMPIGSGWEGGATTPRQAPTGAQIARVLSDPRIDLDASGSQDVASGQIDGRLLDALSATAAQFGFVKVTSLKRDHGVYTASGNISAHSYGCAADIGTIGSTYITPASQTPGSEVDLAVRFLAGLPGPMAPHQVISLFDYGGATMRMGDHGDHIHLGYSC